MLTLQLISPDGCTVVRRLERYWEKRILAYQTRAFLPMNQTGHGVLSRDDIKLLSRSVFMVLPCDVDGRPVLCCDYRQVTKQDTFEASLRCFFYLCAVLGEEEVAQTKGLRVVYINDSAKMKHVYDLLGFYDFVEKALPLHLHSLHICVRSSWANAIDKSSFEASVHHSLGLFLRERTSVIVSYENGAIAQQLQTDGFVAAGLPEVLGGSWLTGRWKDWLASRLQVEQARMVTRRQAAQLSRPSGARVSGNNGSTPVPESLLSLAEIAEIAASQDQEKDLNKRKMGIIYSRRKRERRRLKTEGLQEQVNKAEDENTALKVESARLEDLLELAKAEVKKYKASCRRCTMAQSRDSSSFLSDVDNNANTTAIDPTAVAGTASVYVTETVDTTIDVSAAAHDMGNALFHQMRSERQPALHTRGMQSVQGLCDNSEENGLQQQAAKLQAHQSSKKSKGSSNKSNKSSKKTKTNVYDDYIDSGGNCVKGSSFSRSNPLTNKATGMNGNNNTRNMNIQYTYNSPEARQHGNPFSYASALNNPTNGAMSALAEQFQHRGLMYGAINPSAESYLSAIVNPPVVNGAVAYDATRREYNGAL
jgi:hypothetical protein